MFFIIIEKGYEKSSVHFVQKPLKNLWLNIFCEETVRIVRLLLKENVRLIFFILKTQGSSKLNLSQQSGMEIRTKAIVFNKFFIVILLPGIQRIILSIKDVMKNLQYILCRNRATSSKRKCAADIFYIEANVWLLLETFQCFLMNVRLLLKTY